MQERRPAQQRPAATPRGTSATRWPRHRATSDDRGSPSPMAKLTARASPGTGHRAGRRATLSRVIRAPELPRPRATYPLVDRPCSRPLPLDMACGNGMDHVMYSVSAGQPS